jgi:hypothetical protein
MDQSEVNETAKDTAGNVQKEVEESARHVRRVLYQSSSEMRFCDEEFRVIFDYKLGKK